MMAAALCKMKSHSNCTALLLRFVLAKFTTDIVAQCLLLIICFFCILIKRHGQN